MSDKPLHRQALDHLGHAALGFVAAAPLLLLGIDNWRGLAAALVVAGWGGVARELGQIHNAENKRHWHLDRTYDVLGHLPGGILVWILGSWVL